MATNKVNLNHISTFAVKLEKTLCLCSHSHIWLRRTAPLFWAPLAHILLIASRLLAACPLTSTAENVFSFFLFLESSLSGVVGPPQLRFYHSRARVWPTSPSCWLSCRFCISFAHSLNVWASGYRNALSLTDELTPEILQWFLLLRTGSSIFGKTPCRRCMGFAWSSVLRTNLPSCFIRWLIWAWLLKARVLKVRGILSLIYTCSLGRCYCCPSKLQRAAAVSVHIQQLQQ